MKSKNLKNKILIQNGKMKAKTSITFLENNNFYIKIISYLKNNGFYHVIDESNIQLKIIQIQEKNFGESINSKLIK